MKAWKCYLFVTTSYLYKKANTGPQTCFFPLTWYNSRPVTRGISLVAKTKYVVRFISRYVPSYGWPFANEATQEIWLDSLQNIKNPQTKQSKK